MVLAVVTAPVPVVGISVVVTDGAVNSVRVEMVSPAVDSVDVALVGSATSCSEVLFLCTMVVLQLDVTKVGANPAPAPTPVFWASAGIMPPVVVTAPAPAPTPSSLDVVSEKNVGPSADDGVVDSELAFWHTTFGISFSIFSYSLLPSENVNFELFVLILLAFFCP